MNTAPIPTRVPIREYMSATEQERFERQQQALTDLYGDWLYKMVSPEAKARLIQERLR